MRYLFLAFSLLSVSLLRAQNYGYMGKKNIINVGLQSACGLISGQLYEGRYSVGLERSLSRSISLFADFQYIKHQFDHGPHDLTSFYCTYTGGNVNQIDYSTSTCMVNRNRYLEISKGVVCGMKIFMNSYGGIAPFGTYFIFSVDYNHTQLKNIIINGDLEKKINSISAVEIHPNDASVNSLFANVGVGNSRIFSRRVVFDISSGLGSIIFNNTALKISAIRDNYHTYYNPTEYIQGSYIEFKSYSRLIWAKLKIGYLF